MSVKPILFSGPMVRAILEGRKSQTRRVLSKHLLRTDERSLMEAKFDAKYRVGDLLYVREAWRCCQQMDKIAPSKLSPYEPVRYEADGALRELSCMMVTPGKFRQGMHMPRWGSRITLRVTDVQVQRLNEISAADAMAEGIEPYDGIDPECSGFKNYSADADPSVWLPPISSFRTLWNSINEDRGFGWDVNPWVIAYTFETILGNVDEVTP